MTKKTCKNCKLLKELVEFSKASGNKDGCNNTCKPCVVERNTAYWRTPVGRISQIYNVQKVNSRERGHPQPDYTQQQLFAWAWDNGLPERIKAWEIANFAKELTPSIDRLDVTKGYTLDNIRLVTWQENNDAQYEGRKSCAIVTRQNRTVQQFSLSGEFIAEYKSIAAAARATGAVRSNINAMCSGANQAIKSVGGFLWKYAKAKEAA